MGSRRIRGDDGFTLVESVVALAIAAAVLAALAAATLLATRASISARAAQQAGNLLNERVEQVRSMDYAAVTMVQSDLAGDARITGSGPYTFADNGETVVFDTVGAVSPHMETVQRNDVDYSISRYVTDASDASGTNKRVTIVVDWTMFGQNKSRRVSTLLVDSRRGLPLPRFTFALSGVTSSPQTVGAGLPVTWGLWVQNLGARDAWNITSDDGKAWNYYLDSNSNGIHEATETTELGDMDGNGAKDTGNLETNGPLYFFAVRTPASGEPTTQTVTFSASSIAQPPPASSAKVQPASFTITGATDPSGAACPTAVACTLVKLHLDQLADGNVPTSTKPMRLLADPGTPQLAEYNYSTEKGSGGVGRYLESGGTTATTDEHKVADFRYQVPSGTHSFSGTASLSISLACTGSATASLTAHLGTSSNNSNLNNFTFNTAASFTAPCTGSATTVSVPIPLTSALSSSQYLTLRVVSANPSSLRLLYDSTSHDAILTMPRTAP